MTQIAALRTQFRDGIVMEAVDQIDKRIGLIRPAPRVVDVPFVVGSPGTPLLGGEMVFLRLGLGGPSTILTWSMAATQKSIPTAGTVTVDVLNGLTMDSLHSVCGSTQPALAGQIEVTDVEPTDWTIALPDPSWLMMIVTAVDTLTEVVGLTLRLAVGGAPTLLGVQDAGGAAVVDASGNAVTWGG